MHSLKGFLQPFVDNECSSQPVVINALEAAKFDVAINERIAPCKMESSERPGHCEAGVGQDFICVQPHEADVACFQTKLAEASDACIEAEMLIDVFPSFIVQDERY